MEFTLSGEKKKTKQKLFKIWYLHAMIRQESKKKIKNSIQDMVSTCHDQVRKSKIKIDFFLINGIYMQ